MFVCVCVCMAPGEAIARRSRRAILTVDGNGHALVEDVAILTLEGGDLAQLVELQVLGGGLGGVNLDDLEIKTVGLSNRLDGGAAGVRLLRGIYASAILFLPENMTGEGIV